MLMQRSQRTEGEEKRHDMTRLNQRKKRGNPGYTAYYWDVGSSVFTADI